MALSARSPLRRWMAVALVTTLLGLTLAAVLGSWRQTVLLRSVAAESARTDAFQKAVQLATVESAMLQAALREPEGEERQAAAEIGAGALAAMHALTARDAEQAGRTGRLIGLQHRLQPRVKRYLELLDRGAEATAHDLLESEIEPLSEQVRQGLEAETNQQIQEYARSLARAQRDSAWMRWGTLLVFLLGLGVLGLVGWSNRAHRRQVERMAAHDPLTGLPNRTAFQSRAEAALAAARTGGQPPTVLMLDLDGFKEVNDNLGHHAGDLLLVEVGRRLSRAVRDKDTVARLGGDEFAVLIRDSDLAIGETAAARISEMFNTPFVVDGITLDIEVSIGIMTGEPSHDMADLLRFADIAMYTAKEHRLGYIRFNSNQAHETASRLTLLGDLRRALDADDEIHLHFQPKISVDSGEVIGAEALARWEHPVRGSVPPGDFIPVLEGTSLIHRFTERVLAMALDQVRRWLDEGHRIPVAVNVSTRSLLDPGFPDTVAQALSAAGVPGDMLCIEITENTVMADPDRAIDVLRRVRALGVSTAIDDFGTGYSSMAYLKILPVDEIKVDRSFVRDMASDHSNYVLVESTVDLGHNLGLVVVAEGVEDDSTVQALHDLGCDIAQGYHFARPLDPEAFTEFLSHRAERPAALKE
jgi:diguanylate cyclase (GGDEF)-like protein